MTGPHGLLACAKALSAGLALLASGGMAAAATTPAGPAHARAPWASAKSAKQFATDVLSSAPLPPGARAWAGKVPEPLRGAGAYEGSTLDLYRIYDVTEPADSALQGYVLARLPGGSLAEVQNGRSSLRGRETSENFSVGLPTFGPHEYSAGLSYGTSTSNGWGCLAPGQACLLRVDAQTTWEPSRQPDEVVPPGDLATLTGYTETSPCCPSSGPVTVKLGAKESARLAEAFDTLPLGPGPGCYGDALLYSVVFRRAKGRGTTYTVDGWQCMSWVAVAAGKEQLHPLYDRGCSLDHVVRLLVPASAKATRTESGPCTGPVY